MTAEVEWSNGVDDSLWKCVLIGKLMSSKSVNKNMMKTMLVKGWSVRDLKITEMESNIFIFSFRSENDRNRVLRNRPWTVTGILLLIQEWNSFLPINEVKWCFSPYWIQFHGMPFGGLSCKNASSW